MNKTYYLLFSVLFFALPISAQQFLPYQWQSPKPQGNPLNDVTAVGSNSFIAIGESGSIIKSTDGGQTWNYQQILEEVSLHSISFPDSTTGYIAGTGYGRSRIYKTQDGGNNWTKIYDSIPPQTGGNLLSLEKIFFVNDTVGYTSGYMNTFLKTTDGGITWNSYPFPSGILNIKMIYFLNNDTGFAYGNYGGLIRTNNGGISWSQLPGIGAGSYINCMKFINDTLGYMAAGNTKIFKTVNGGLNWALSFQGTLTSYIHDIDFTSPTTGIAIANWYIYRTTNGTTWNATFQTSTNYTSMALLPNGKYTIVESSAKISKGASISAAPVIVNTNAGPYTIHKIKFTSAQVGWAVGEYGLVRKTVDGGQTWTTINTTFGAESFYDFAVPTPNTILIACYSGLIVKSTNGGTTWTSQTITTQPLRCMQFVNSSLGFVAGDSGRVYRTTNGGANWTQLITNSNYNCIRIQFLNTSIGYLMMNIGQMMKTSNGGATWTAVNISYAWYSNAMYFTGIDTGYFADETYKLFKSTNAFSTSTIDTICFQKALDIYFTDRNHGYIVGSSVNDDEYCDLLYTNNAGQTWNSFSLPYSMNLSTIYALDTNNIYIAGGNSSIIKVGNGQLITDEKIKTPLYGNTIEIFPIPATDKLSIYANEKISSIEVFTTSGVLINSSNTVVSEFTELNIADLNNGVYFIRIRTKNTLVSKKIIVSR